MNFFDMGPLEILLILIVALVIWGPGKIPELARTLGKTLRAFRKATTDLTNAVTRELELEEKKPPSQPKTKREHKTQESPEASQTEAKDTDTANPEDKGKP